LNSKISVEIDFVLWFPSGTKLTKEQVCLVGIEEPFLQGTAGMSFKIISFIAKHEKYEVSNDVLHLGVVVPCIFNHSNKNTQIDATINHKIYCFVLQIPLNMFRVMGSIHIPQLPNKEGN